jgi:two-component system OmpR family response regulator
MYRVLLMDQEQQLFHKLEIEFHIEGFDLTLVTSAAEGLMKFGDGKWDLLLISNRLLNASGIQVLLEIRKKDKGIPIIYLIDASTYPDKSRLFRLGVNDVYDRSTGIEELISRCFNLLIQFKNPPVDERYMQIGNLYLDIHTRAVFRDHQPIHLSPTEYKLLIYLLSQKGKAVSREQLLEKVWGYGFSGGTNLVDVYVRYLRMKIDKGNRRKLIKTVRGYGYMISDE